MQQSKNTSTWVIATALLFFNACASHTHHAAMSTKDFKSLPKVAMLNTQDLNKDSLPSPQVIAQKQLPLTRDGITLTEGALCTAINELTPVTSENTFSNDVGRVYMFSKVSVTPAITEDQRIRHVWYFKDRPIASVRLTVKGENYRTYSSKLIPPAYRGNWRVDVVTSNNKVIESFPFTVN